MPRTIIGYDAQGNTIGRMSTAAEDANIPTLVTRAQTALAANATFLAIASPTTAQVATQAKALTRQVDALIHFLLGDINSITDS